MEKLANDPEDENNEVVVPSSDEELRLCLMQALQLELQRLRAQLAEEATARCKSFVGQSNSENEGDTAS